MKRFIPGILSTLLFAACVGEPAGLPQLAQRTAERYLHAWQAGQWTTIYAMEGREPQADPLLHHALTDSLEFYQIGEVRYADTTAACAVVLRWRTPAGTYSESGELYLTRRGPDWRIKGYRKF